MPNFDPILIKLKMYYLFLKILTCTKNEHDRNITSSSMPKKSIISENLIWRMCSILVQFDEIKNVFFILVFYGQKLTNYLLG